MNNTLVDCKNCGASSFDVVESTRNRNRLYHCKECGEVVTEDGEILIPGIPENTSTDELEELLKCVNLYLSIQLERLHLVSELTYKVISGEADENDYTMIYELIIPEE